jgi:RNA polymerase-binding transcription factor DksA
MRRVVLSKMFDLLDTSCDVGMTREEFINGASLHQIDAILSFKSDTHLDELRGALDRIDEGTFGICLGCKGEISRQLLIEDPSLRMCHVCEDEVNHPASRMDFHWMDQ